MALHVPMKSEKDKMIELLIQMTGDPYEIIHYNVEERVILQLNCRNCAAPVKYKECEYCGSLN